MKFRNCFFEFAGVYSGKYNLRLVYVENSNRNFDSGGSFDFKFGQIPYYHEQLYYGKDYSANPLQFEIEILNVDGYITETQMIEIKEWLFGGNGWKKFKPLNGTNNKSLRCILTPIADITEGNHYKGLRFNLRNASPFWYGEEKEIIIKNDELIDGWSYFTGSQKTYENGTWAWGGFNINIPSNDNVDIEIFPDIILDVDKSMSSYAQNLNRFIMANTSASTKADVLSKSTIVIDENHNYNEWDYPDKSKIMCDLSFVSEDTDKIYISSRYMILQSETYPSQDIVIKINEDNPTKGFRLNYGLNLCRIFLPQGIKSLTIKYTPMYRMGAF